MLKTHSLINYFVYTLIAGFLIAQDDFGDDFGDDSQSTPIEGQTITITGTVTSENGKPLPGANIVVDGTRI